MPLVHSLKIQRVRMIATQLRAQYADRALRRARCAGRASSCGANLRRLCSGAGLMPRRVETVFLEGEPGKARFVTRTLR
jgi:hypothetical protein